MHLKLCNFGNYEGKKVSLPPKEEPSRDVDKRIHLYRRISAILLLLCVVLLAVVLALAVKLSEAQSSQQCPEEIKEVTSPDETCSRQTCQRLYPVQSKQNHGVHLCSDCEKGWYKHEDSCYLLSKTRLNWYESRDECQKLGGNLAIIKNERVQRFLTEKALMFYWIGLSHSETEQWTWVNNDSVTLSYWAQPPADGKCAILRGRTSEKNWYTNPCQYYSHFICQKG